MNNEQTRQDGFMDDDANKSRNEDDGRDKQHNGEEKNGKNPDRRKRIPPHGKRCDPNLNQERYEGNAGQRKSPHWETEPGFRNPADQFSQEELQRFREMEIPPLGRDFVILAEKFESFIEIGRGFMAGMRSLNAVSRGLEQRQIEKTYPQELPVSVATLHRVISDMEVFFKEHFQLKTYPRLVVRPGDGLPMNRLTGAGHIAWELSRKLLVAMGYKDVGDSR